LDAASAIVVGRTLSSYTVPGIQNNQETITLTVYNAQADPITGVLLTDTLQPSVTFQSASQLPDQSGQNLAWSLGTINGFDRASVTLTVSLVNPIPLQLDAGAHAFAMLDAGAVSNATPAATLRPGSVPPSLLASTPDANTTDPYIQEEAAKLNYDPQQIFAFLHNDVGYNSYVGSLRGARGTLWSSAGNALDVASLGVALMRASGIPAQYVSGTLSQSQAQQLILSMFPASFQTVGYIPAGTQTADPAHDPQLLAETVSHYWFQFDSGSGLQNADPLMAGATVGQTFTASTGTFTEVPDNLREKTEVKLTAEIYSQASAVFGSNPLSNTVVLDQTFNDVDLVGRPITIGNFVSSSTAGLGIVRQTNTYTPFIVVGDDALPDSQLPEPILGQPYQEVLTNFPLGSQILTGLFLDVTLSGPGTSSQTFNRALVDRIGYAARQGLVPPAGGSVNPADPPIITPLDLTTLNILPGFQTPGAAQLAQERATQELARISSETDPSPAAQVEALIAAARAELGNLAVASDQETANLATGFSVAAYFNSPRITAFSSHVVTSNNQCTLSFSFDLMHDSVRAIASPGQNVQAQLSFASARGLFDSFLEAQALPVAPGGQNLSAVAIIGQAHQQGIPLAAINANNLTLLQTFNLPAEAMARITRNIQNGHTVIVPIQAVTVNGVQTTAWLNHDPTTGEIIAESQDGRNQGLIEYAFLLYHVALLVTFVSWEFTLTNPPLPNDQLAKAAVGIGLGLAATAVALSTIAAPILVLALSVDAGLFALLAVKDPPLAPVTSNLNLPFPTISADASTTKTQVQSVRTAGQIAGNAQASTLAVSGSLSASWSSSANNSFQATSLNSASATVRNAQGAVIGSGAIALASPGTVPVNISGTDSYSVSGAGSLSFYGPAATSLGVSGNWDNYATTVTGNVSIAITTDGLTLNGQALPAGTYTITTNSATLSGSGPSTSPNFSGSASISATGGTVHLGPGTGNVTIGGQALDLSSGATLTSYSGTINVTANGNGTDAVTLNGNAANVLAVSATPATFTTNQNTPITFHANVNTSFADTYDLTAQAPPGWTVTIDNNGNVTATPAPGLQTGTYSIQIIAQSTTNSDLIAQTTVNVTLTPTAPGLNFNVLPDPLFTVPFNGAQLPTAFRANLQNLGPSADTYNLTFANVPSGFTLLNSGTSVTVPAGQTGILGLYLQLNPGQQIPPPGTQLSFTVTATSTTNPSITQTQVVTFTMPAVKAATVTGTPPALNTTPGTPVTATLTLTNVGNVPATVAVDISGPAGLAVTGLAPVTLAVGQSTTQTITLTPAAGTPLNSTLTATVNYGDPPLQNTVAVLQVAPSPAFVEAGQMPYVSATVFTGVSQARQALASYTITSPSGAVVFTSAAVPVHLSAVGTTTTMDLGPVDTTGFGPGAYTVTVSLREQNGQPIAGATGHGTLFVHAPVVASLSLDSTSLPPGDGTVISTLTLASNNTTDSIAVAASVQIPKNIGVAVVPGSFSLAPTQLIDGPTFQTLVCNVTLAPGAIRTITWQSTLSTLQAGEVRAVTLATTIQQGTGPSFSLAPLSVAGASPVQTLQFPVQVVVPGAAAIANASVAAGQLGKTDLAARLNDLSIALTNLVQNPTSAVYKSQALASIDAIGVLANADPILAGSTGGLAAARAELAAASTSVAILTAINDLANALSSLAGALADDTAHGFNFNLSPSSTVALLGAPATILLMLQNTGTQATTYDLSVSGLPAKVTAVFVQNSQPITSVTLQPGQVIFGGPNGVSLLLTETGGSIVPANFTVTVTAEGATEITRNAPGSLTVPANFFQVAEVDATPPFANPGTPVNVSARVLANLGQAQQALASYTVADATGHVVFTSIPVPVTFPVQSSLTIVDLGSFATTSLALDNYILTVTLTDTHGAPLPGGSGQGRVQIGTPVSATIGFETDLTRDLPGTTATASSYYSASYRPSNAIDGDLHTSWFATLGDSATHDHTSPFIEVDFPTEVVVDRVELYGPRDYPTGYNILAGVVQLFDANGTQLYKSGTVNLSIGAFHDGVVTFPAVAGVRRVRFTSTMDEGNDPGLAEVKIFGMRALLPGSATVTNSLTVNAQVNLNNTLTLDGQVQTTPTSNSVALYQDATHNFAYVAGTNGVDIVDVSNPAAPVKLSTFAAPPLVVQGGYTVVRTDNTGGTNYLLIGTTTPVNADHFTMLVYSLADPRSPTLVNGPTGTRFNYAFMNDMLVQGNTVLVPTGGISAFLGSITDQYGSLLCINVSNPAAPQLEPPGSVLLYIPDPRFSNTANQNGGVIVNSQIAYIASTTSTGGATQIGEGRVLVVNYSNPSGLAFQAPRIPIPGTVQVLDIAIQGNRALVVGSTGGWLSPFDPIHGTLGLTGNMTLSVLDITNPQDPHLLGTTRVTDGTFPTSAMGVGKISALALGNGLFAVSEALINGNPVLMMVNPSDPNNIVVVSMPEPAPVDEMAVAGNLLYITSSAGLAIYNIGQIPSIPYTVSVEVPKNTLVAGSFNTPPTSIDTSNPNYDTLVFNRSFTFGQASANFTWQSHLTDLTGGQFALVTLGTTITFVSQSTPGTLSLPPTGLPVIHIVSLTPLSQSVAPGATASYTVHLLNPTSAAVTYNLAVQGVPASWVMLPGSVMLAANGSADVMLQLTPNAAATAADNNFAVTASTAGGVNDTAAGDLVVTPQTPPVDPDSHGVVVAHTPAQASAGQGTSAIYNVQVTNTGSAVDTFSLAIAGLPPGVTATFGHASVQVPPGVSNFRDVTLTLTSAPGTAPGNYVFHVMATSTTISSVTATADGTLTLLANGVHVTLSPGSGAPGSTFQLMVTNTGQVADTFDLALASPGGLVATLGMTSVTLAAGASQTVPITTGAVTFAVPGPMDLTAMATSHTSPAVQDAATAHLMIPQTTGLTAQFNPVSQTIPAPGTASFLLLVNNIGNMEDSYTAVITGTSGPITAQLIGLDGLPAQRISLFRLPGLSTGVILVQTNLTDLGPGTVTVQIMSLSPGGMTVSATATVSTAVVDIPPVMTAPANQSATAGVTQAFTLGSFVDPDGGPWAVDINWGDGTAHTTFPAATAGSLGTQSHTYAAPGPYTVTVIVTDTTDGQSDAKTFQVTVTPPSTPVQDEQTEEAAFWISSEGQALIRSFNGGSTHTALADWLVSSFPHLYGADAGPNNLTGKTNAQVAAFFQGLWDHDHENADLEVLTTALNIYATTESLGGAEGRTHEFLVTAGGLGASTYDVGDDGAAFGVADHTSLTVLQLLQAADARAVSGRLYDGDTHLQDLAEELFESLNIFGD
jgi:uncharacterized membrane protein